jgi:hypothetical protein
MLIGNSQPESYEEEKQSQSLLVEFIWHIMDLTDGVYVASADAVET